MITKKMKEIKTLFKKDYIRPHVAVFDVAAARVNHKYGAAVGEVALVGVGGGDGARFVDDDDAGGDACAVKEVGG